MGTLNNGLFGGYTGKVGKLVGYRLMGKDVLRVVGKNDKPASLKQLVCRQEMSVVIDFLKPITDFINIGFKFKALQTKKYPYNMAVSYHKKNALKGTYPNIVLNYSCALVTQGHLLPAKKPQVELLAEGLKFTWQVSPTMCWPDTTDMAMLLACFPLLNKAVYCIGCAKRIVGTGFLPLEQELVTEYMETYISFISIENNDVANSTYTGRLNSK